MKINNLLKGIKVLEIKGDTNVEIFSLSQKINNCKRGCLFFCFKGVNFDGHNFVQMAINNGATCILCEKFVDGCNVLQIKVKNVRDVIFKVCNNFYNNLIKSFKFIGVTGTNGKTTCTTIIKSIIENSGNQCCLIGTNGVEIGNEKFETTLTTPDTVDFFNILNKAKTKSVKYVVMEVSAHAIDLKKLKGLKFEVGVFTNLTQDHLDYFKTMHNYAVTKLKFLKKSYCKNVVINIDDEYGKLFSKLSNTKVYQYALDSPAQNFAMDVNLNINGTSFLANILNSVCEIKTKLICKFNVYNILASCICAKILGFDVDCIVNTVNNLKAISGRVNTYKLKNSATVIIDYAHTPDGLQKILENLRGLNSGSKIITVFGCGGNRDKTKRYKMGQIAASLSDEIILTNDNPRYENEQDIITDILKGIKKKVLIDTNRKNAIENAIKLSKAEDVILIAGKGCEKYQEINGIKVPFCDEDIIKSFC